VDHEFRRTAQLRSADDLPGRAVGQLETAPRSPALDRAGGRCRGAGGVPLRAALFRLPAAPP
jgi:hypothetical protein